MLNQTPKLEFTLEKQYQSYQTLKPPRYTMFEPLLKLKSEIINVQYFYHSFFPYLIFDFPHASVTFDPKRPYCTSDTANRRHIKY